MKKGTKEEIVEGIVIVLKMIEKIEGMVAEKDLDVINAMDGTENVVVSIFQFGLSIVVNMMILIVTAIEGITVT